MLWLCVVYFGIGMAAEVQPPSWLWSQILLLPHVPGHRLNGVEAVFCSRSFKQVRGGLDKESKFKIWNYSENTLQNFKKADIQKKPL